MKIEVANRVALVSDYSPQEELFLKKHLSWGELSYKNMDLFTTEYGKLPVSEFSEIPPAGSYKSKSITILLAKLSDDRIYTLKHALFYVLEKFGEEIKFDKSSIRQEEELPNLGKIDPNYLPDITLRDYQEKTINKALTFGSGIVKAAVGSGKTEMQICISSYIIEHNISEYVLIVCPSLALVENFYERCRKYGVSCQMFTSGKSIDKNIRIIVANIDAVRNQFNKKGIYCSILKKCGTVIFDEAHHCRADTFFQVIVTINPRYLLEFSGTPFQNNDFYSNYPDFLVYALCGRIVSNVSASYLIKRGFLAQPYFTFIPVGKRHYFLEKSWHTVENRYIVKCTERNKLIEEWAKVFVQYKMKTLILVRKLDHLDLLLTQLSKNVTPRVIGIKGSRQGRVYDESTNSVEEFEINYESILNKFRNDEYDILIANQVADEGVDLVGVQCLILATSGKSFIKTNQRIGRGIRAKKKGLNEVYVVDFTDNGHPYTAKHSKERREHLLSLGAIELNQQDFINRVYNNYQLSLEE